MKLEDFKKMPDYAFPQVVDVEGLTGHMETGRLFGMTLRDYFAAKALTAIVAESMAYERTRDEAEGTWDPEQFAEDAYSVADAMMKARETKEAPPAPITQP